MSTNFPASGDGAARPTPTTLRNDPSLALSIVTSDLMDARDALFAKVGFTNSVVTTSHDYLLHHLAAAGLAEAPGAAAAALASAQTYADGKVSDTAYDATTWNGVTTAAPSKNAVRDYLNTLGTAAFTNSTAYDAAGLAAAALVTAEAYTDIAVAAAGAGFVPTSRTVNGHALSANVTVTASDVGLGSVENTALSTWAGSASITTLGTIVAGSIPYSLVSGTPTITAAALTVLDDATVAAMVDTLGGASSTGTGGLVRVSGPTFTGIPAGPTAAALTSTTQLATTAFVTGAVATAVTGTLRFMGATDCSANPNYPAASKGDVYVVSVAGKIGGASGTAVDVGDEYFATADNAGGTQAAVGASWAVLEHNLQGALLSANNLSDVANSDTAINNLGGATATGTGALVRKGSPTLTTPNIGLATVTSINGNTISSGSGTLTLSTFTLTVAATASVSGTNTGDSASQPRLTLTTVKTGTYAASVGDYVPFDTTSGSGTLNLPSAPTDGSVIAVKHVVRGGTNTITVNCGGSDKFNVVGGSASGTVTVSGQAMTFQYKSSAGLWYVMDSLPFGQVMNAVLTGYTSGAGTVAATDSILAAIQKLNGNDAFARACSILMF